jgi:putative DNA primase/helicase
MQLNGRTRAAPIARRAADLVWALKGRRCGAGWICRCPAHDDHHPSLSIAERDGKVLIKCWSGCGQDAVLDALRQRGLWEGKARETSQAGRPHAFIAERETSLKPCDPMKAFRNAGLFARRSPADRYLETRGLELTGDEASSLRFAPALWHWPTQSRWPAMLARVSLYTGAEIATHQTFVEPDGSGKAPLGKQARLFASGGRTIGGGVWFGEADSNREFIVAEGIESTLSAMRVFDVTAGCAALSEIGIRRLILPSTARRVRIFADHDELGQGLNAAREAGRRWLAEGRAVAVSMSPTVGEDANDIWLRTRNP